MGQEADTEIPARNFIGMASNADRRDLRPEQAVVQLNLAVRRRAELTVRRGLKELTFDEDPS